MRFVLPLLFAAPANAHVGLLGEAARHDHWVAGTAISIAAAITIWGVRKRKNRNEEPELEIDGEEEVEA